MKHKIILAFWLFIAAMATTLKGHDAHYQDTKPRIWETSSGSVTGSFYLIKNQNVLIEEPSGNIRLLPIASLSTKDKAFIAQKQAWIDKINHMHGATATKKTETLITTISCIVERKQGTHKSFRSYSHHLGFVRTGDNHSIHAQTPTVALRYTRLGNGYFIDGQQLQLSHTQSDGIDYPNFVFGQCLFVLQAKHFNPLRQYLLLR